MCLRPSVSSPARIYMNFILYLAVQHHFVPIILYITGCHKQTLFYSKRTLNVRLLLVTEYFISSTQCSFTVSSLSHHLHSVSNLLSVSVLYLNLNDINGPDKIIETLLSIILYGSTTAQTKILQNNCTVKSAPL